MDVDERAVLRVRGRENVDEVIELGHTPFTVGRAGNDLNLADGSVSRRHCELVRTDLGWLVRDLKSSNGTQVNGERVAERGLVDGDRLRFGQTEAVFRLLAPTAALAEAAGQSMPSSAGPVGTDTALWNLVELSVGASEEARWLNGYLESVLKRFGADRGFVVRYEPLTGSLTALASLAMSYDEEPVEGAVPISRTIVDQAIRERRTISTTNAEVDPRFREAASVAQYDISAVLCAPARWQGAPLGAVYVERALGKETFSEVDAQRLQDLADLLGVAMMAWRAHGHAQGEWERDLLARSFSGGEVASILEQGGVGAIRREVRDVTAVMVHCGKLDAVMGAGNAEAWRLVSQFLAQSTETVLKHRGASVGGGLALFGALAEEGADFTGDAVRAGIEIQKAARLLVNRLGRELKVALSVSVAVTSGPALVGYFGSGARVDFLGLGEVMAAALGLAFHANDGEVLVDQSTYNRVRLSFNTHRLSPVSLPGVARQVQPFRVVSF